MRLNFDEWMIRQGRLGGARYGNGAFYFVGWRTTADIMVAASYVLWCPTMHVVGRRLRQRLVEC